MVRTLGSMSSALVCFLVMNVTCKLSMMEPSGPAPRRRIQRFSRGIIREPRGQLVTVHVTTGVVSQIDSFRGDGTLSDADLAFDASGALERATSDGSFCLTRALFILSKSGSEIFHGSGHGDDGGSSVCPTDNGLPAPIL